jgi:hypothetical protein
MLRTLVGVFGIGGVLMVAGAASATSPADDVPFPRGSGTERSIR